MLNHNFTSQVNLRQTIKWKIVIQLKVLRDRMLTIGQADCLMKFRNMFVESTFLLPTKLKHSRTLIKRLAAKIPEIFLTT